MGSYEHSLERLQTLLEAYSKSGRPESMVAIRDLLKELERAELLKELGCPDDCSRCTWGKEEPHGFEDHCVFNAFFQTVQDASYQGRKGDSHMQRHAGGMAEILRRSPRPDLKGK